MKRVLILLSLISTLTFGANKEIVDEMIRVDNIVYEKMRYLLSHEQEELEMVMKNTSIKHLRMIEKEKTFLEKNTLESYYSNSFPNQVALESLERLTRLDPALDNIINKLNDIKNRR